MTQEHIMKKKMHLAFWLFGIAFIALLIFIGLYIDETRRVQKTYREQFNACLAHTADSVESYLDAEGDWELKYRRILSDISSADSFAFLLENLTQEQKIAVNELHTIVLKYPEQMKETERLEALLQTVSDLQENLDKGFQEAEELVSTIDKKGH
ncbi:MAG: hypothetical protein IJJ69_00735 [Oscillospiraceae bacterium]|nr:hypothetical protein [Oscillospiraceae bacterium]